LRARVMISCCFIVVPRQPERWFSFN